VMERWNPENRIDSDKSDCATWLEEVQKRLPSVSTLVKSVPEDLGEAADDQSVQDESVNADLVRLAGTKRSGIPVRMHGLVLCSCLFYVFLATIANSLLSGTKGEPATSE
jgi:hypothetical protein